MGRDVPRWVAPAVAGCVAMAFALAGTGGGGVLILVLLAIAAVVGAGSRRRASATVVAEGDRWPGIPVAAPVVGEPGHPRQLATALARIEARELFFCAWFGAGLGFLAVIVLAYAVVFPDDNGDVWAVIADQVPWFAHPIAGMTILAVHRGATRPARDGTDDLFASCPSGESVRVAALLRTAVVPVAAVVVFLVVLFAGLWLNSPGLHGGLVASSLPSMLAGPVLVVGAAFLGVALGVWTRFRLAPAVAVVVVGFLSLRFATAGDPGWNRLSALSTFGPQMDSPLLYPLAHGWPYVVWMAALSGLVALVAVMRFRRDRVVAAWGCGLVVVALVAGVLAVRPVSGDHARRVADLIARPADHQTCSGSPASAFVSVSVCTFASYGELRRRVASAVSPVGQALPVRVPAITVRQGFDGTLSDLPSEVRRLLPAGIPASAAGELRIGFAGDDDALVGYRLRVAFLALGLPLGPDADGLPYVNDGEARGVVALWLAVRGLPVEEARHLVRPLPGDDAFERGQAWPQMCGPVVWSPQDLAAARSVLALDESTVAAVVAGGWARWSDPATSTDALLASLDLPSAGPYDRVTPRRERFC